MSRNATGHALVLWMERDGEIYSPAMVLARSSEEALERDLWECAYAGVCHSIYRYGTHGNGGSYCREITPEVAARLGRLSLATRRRPAEPVRVFLQNFGEDFFDEIEAPAADVLARPFEMWAPRPSATSTRVPRRKSRAKRLDPEDLRAQPQFKLPIAGGKAISSHSTEGEAEKTTEADETGIERLSLKDARPAEEQAAAWERFDRKLREMGVKAPAETGSRQGDVGEDATAPRRSLGSRS